MALDTVVMMRFPSDVKEALRLAAEREHLSMSRLALVVLSAWLREGGYLASPKAGPRRGRGGGSRRTP